MTAVWESWDHDYRNRGRLWGGSVPFISRLPPSSRILELGCGNGKNVLSLIQEGSTVTAVDFSPHAAALCRKSCKDPDRARIVIADCRRLPFCDNSFDIILASHITAHLTSDGRDDLVTECRRLLRVEGSFFFRDFSVEDFRYGQGTMTETATFVRKNGIATHFFSPGEVRDLFSGFTVNKLDVHRWQMRIRGTVYPRAEIIAEFLKI